MKAEQKFRLARTIIIAMTICFTTIAIVWLVVIHNPSSMKMAIDFGNRKVEVDCKFMDKK